jgi:hypothetical protein
MFVSAYRLGRAHNAVSVAVREGRLDRGPCEVCGAVDQPYEVPGPRGSVRLAHTIEMHHWSYLDEHFLDVIPLCKQHHDAVHLGQIPEPRTGRIYENNRVAGARRARRVAA